MFITIFISVLTMITLVFFMIVKPTLSISFKQKIVSIQTFWIISVLGALCLLSLGCISKESIKQLFDFKIAMNPFKILILFLSIGLLSIVLEEVGFFELCANYVLHKVKYSQKVLFCLLYLTIAILTIFTSNDIIILTFTPLICYFTKQKKMNPIPYLVGEFTAANTLSLLFVIGNPTNIYLATYYDITFFSYLKMMALPTIAISVVAFLLVYFIFYKKLKEPISQEEIQRVVSIQNKHLLIVGLIHLILCTLGLVLSSYFQFEMWYICLGFALSISLYILIYDKVTHHHYGTKMYRKLPWSLVPFVLSMFILVLLLKEKGILQMVAQGFSQLGNHKTETLPWIYGITSYFACSLMNNIPMSVAYASILESVPQSTLSLYATIIGSNLGALFTPVGALAGMMWLGYLKRQEIEFTFFSFMKYGLWISLPALLVGIGVLLIL